MYRFVLASELPAGFESWFPAMTVVTGAHGTVTLEGPVIDACQMAGIVNAICHRNGEILQVERLTRFQNPEH